MMTVVVHSACFLFIYSYLASEARLEVTVEVFLTMELSVELI